APMVAPTAAAGSGGQARRTRRFRTGPGTGPVPARAPRGRAHALVTATPVGPGRYAWLGCAGTGPPSALRRSGMRSDTIGGGRTHRCAPSSLVGRVRPGR